MSSYIYFSGSGLCLRVLFSFWKHDDAMHMMTWWNATRKKMTWQQQQITWRHLAHRSWGVTTLHHYERILSRDLEWHRRENGREREEVKLSCFFENEWNQEPWEVKPFREKDTTEMNEVDNSPLEKGNKEEQIRTSLRLKRDAGLDQMKRTWAEDTTLLLNG